MNGRKVTRRILIVLALLSVGVTGLLYYGYQSSKLDLTNMDDLLTLEKNVGFHPLSKDVYVGAAGFIDQTIFYKARVVPPEVQWLDRVPKVSEFPPPNHAPVWWKISFWWHAQSSDMRYYRTTAKWPCIYAYSTKSGWLYGTVEYE